MNFNFGIKIKEGLTFDDILLVPKHSNIDSRSTVDVSVNINDIKFKHPIIPANMKSIMGKEMINAIVANDGMGIMHRFLPWEELYYHINYSTDKIGFSVGVQEEDKESAGRFVDTGVKIICIDIAHGDSDKAIKMTEFIRKLDDDLIIIAGNVATSRGAANLWKAGADIVKVGVGGGCFAAGTRVLMANGFYKNIEEVTIGDFVINKNGNPVKVINSFMTGVKKVVKVKNSSCYRHTYVTPDHKFWIGDLSTVSKNTLQSYGYKKVLGTKSKTTPKQSKYKWKEISESKGDVFLFPKNINFILKDSFDINLKKRKLGNNKTGYIYENDCNLKPSYDLGYIFGTFLGDGSSSCSTYKRSRRGSVSWYFGKTEMCIADKLALSIKKCLNKQAVIKQRKSIINVNLYYKPMADFLSEFGKKTNKHLPESLLVNNKKYIQGIYDGLIDSDGCRGKDGRLLFSNTSSQLIELFNILNHILYGYLPNNCINKKTIGSLKGTDIENIKDSYQCQTLKTPRHRLTEDNYVIKQTYHDELEIGVPVYDITVDCDTHSFIADNMIVHNSLCTTRIETGNGVPQLTALIDVFEKRQFWEDHLGKKLYIIGDGGIKSAGDMIKALCFCDMVMAGNIFAGCPETPGKNLRIGDNTYKEYVGSSTHKTKYIEGVSALVPTKNSFDIVLQKMLDGIRSGCSYQGVSNLTDLKKDPEFVRITNSGLIESKPHNIIMV